MELNYSINLKQKEDLDLKNNLVNTSDNLSLKVFNFDNEIQIVSNSDTISNYFEETTEVVNHLNKAENFILSYTNLKDKMKFKNEINEDLLNSNLYNIHNLYLVKSAKSLPKIKSNDYYELFILEEDTFKLVEKSEYAIDTQTNTLNNLQEDTDYFLYLIKNDFKYKKATNNFNIKSEDFLDISSGFYEIYPQFKNTSELINLIEKSTDFLVFNSNSINTIESDMYINFDNCITDKFTSIPFNNIDIKYKSNDYTPLAQIESFDNSKEYIVFELENNNCIPKYFLSSDVETEGDLESIENFNLLIQSHSEFKKPFLVIANKSNIVVLKENLEVVLNRTIYNEEFSNIKNTILIDTLTKIQI